MLDAEVRATTETPTLTPNTELQHPPFAEHQCEQTMLQTFAACQDILMADGAVDWNHGASIDSMDMEMGVQTYLVRRYVDTQLQSGITNKSEGEMIIDWILAFGEDLRTFFTRGIYDPLAIENEIYGQTH